MRKALCLAAALVAGSTLAAAPQAGAAVGLVPVGNYELPVHVAVDPTDPDRVFVVERRGRIMLTVDGETRTFLDIRSEIPDLGEIDDRGLLSMAFAPDFATSGLVYILYGGSDNVVHVDEFAAAGDVVGVGTRRSVLEIPHLTGVHYGGQIQFGPDGYLYVSSGDDGLTGDPDENGQDTETLLGKILRIDPRPSGTDAYTVPADNPFVGVPGRDEIWGYGLRNPWRFSFDRGTGDLLLSDVGQDSWEEINLSTHLSGGGRGANYGWKCREGPVAYSGCLGTFVEPAFAFPHTSPICTSLTGGYVVRDPGLPSLAGRYLYADFCGDEMRSVSLGDPGSDALVGTIDRPTSFGEDSCGRIYVTSYLGAVSRLVEGPATDCKRPAVALWGKRRQVVRDGAKLVVNAYATEAAKVTVRARSGTLRLKPKTVKVGARRSRKISWKLGDKAVVRVARSAQEGSVQVTFRATGVDLAGNRSDPFERVVRVRPAAG